MPANQESDSNFKATRRAIVEVAFIIFLFYSNLLMGEFTAASSHGKTFVVALNDIFTLTNFLIAVVSASLGHFFFEMIRRRL
jgi:hypothetical protein